MRIKDVVASAKNNVTCDGWNTGRMPKSLFPLGKSGKHYLNFRGGYEWCSMAFEALGCNFRVIVAVNFEKHEYHAHLGRTFPGDTQMLCSLEYHGTHPGWHLHAGCGDVTLIPIGRYMGSWRKRIPRDGAKCRRTAWDVSSKEDALRKACEAFGIERPSSGSAEGQMQLL